jgi:alkylhydroperoxidase/carboxymuconolactone decarboxylase family protein YurZ
MFEEVISTLRLQLQNRGVSPEQISNVVGQIQPQHGSNLSVHIAAVLDGLGLSGEDIQDIVQNVMLQDSNTDKSDME